MAIAATSSSGHIAYNKPAKKALTSRQPRQQVLAKSKSNQSIQKYRDRIQSFTGTRPHFDRELLELFASNKYHSFFTCALYVVILFAGSLTLISKEIAIFFGLLMACIQLSEWACIKKYEKQENAKIQGAVWSFSFAVIRGISGLIWGALFFTLMVQDANFNYSAFIFSMMLVVIAMGSMLSYSLPMAVLANTMPISLSVALFYGTQHENQLLLMAITAIGANIFFIFMAQNMYKNALAMLEARVEKDMLIGELEQQKAIAENARNRSEEANLAKSKFLATMSHELRTPLNAILGFSEVMVTESFGPLPNEHYKDYVKDIHRSGKHLLNLINEILDLSRIEAGRHELSEESIQINYVVEDAVRLLRMKARDKNINILENYEANLPKLWADERAIRQIVLNILSNAIKFTPENGEISICVGWVSSGGQYISIKDTGPGIPEEEIETVLSNFGQGSLAIKTAEQGTGLGLPIIRSLVEMHQGAFDFRSKLGEGTEVICSFPKARVMEVMPRMENNARFA